MANCRSCKAEIIWLKHHETHKPAPIDVEGSPHGNIVINRDRGIYRMATGNEKDIAKHHNRKLYTNHFMTCPDREKHKKKSEDS